MQRRLIFIFLFSLLIWSCQSEEELKWYPFNPVSKTSNSIINMSDWLDKPAGKHGFVQAKGNQLQFENGMPVKFWGVNICSSKPYVEPDVADQYADFLASYGVNAVRFHKHTSHGMPEHTSVDLREDAYQRLDYFHSRLRDKGIYYGWSPIYGHKPRPADSARLLAYDEIRQADLDSHLRFSTIGLVNFAEDLQDLHIDLITNMLNHKNPETGLRYADDPALAFVEFQNEDNIYFATADAMIERCPTYKALITNKFSNWLKKEYGSHEALVQAWGEEAFAWGRDVRHEAWHLDSMNIRPVCSHGIYDYEYKQATEQGEPLPKFLLDMAYFLFEEQLTFYEKFEKAVRKTGYQGALVGSCWQAGSGIAHYYNLFTDAKMGLVDRHNYFGGGTGHRLVPGEFRNEAMVSTPGSGMLSTGAQMVEGHPFALSEWKSLVPNEWVAESPPIVAFYGLGLQGWDASYAFAVDFPHFTETIHTPGVYNVTSPAHLGQYPAIVSALYDGNIEEGEIIASRNVHLPSLREGKLGFKDVQKQDWDQKSFESVPRDAFAAGRVVVDYTDQFQTTESPDLNPYIENDVIRSSTGQLEWSKSGKGFFTVNTPGLQGFVGFNERETYKLRDVEILTENPFAVIIVSSLEKGVPISESPSILVTALARSRNSGMLFNRDTTEIIEVGEAPILMEPVEFTLSFADNSPGQMNILDHSGNPTGKVIKARKGSFVVRGKDTQTLYYQLVR